MSNAPVFVVGVFSGEEKLGEGEFTLLVRSRLRELNLIVFGLTEVLSFFL